MSLFRDVPNIDVCVGRCIVHDVICGDCVCVWQHCYQVDDDDRDFRRSRSRGGRLGDVRSRAARGGVRGGGRGEEGGGTISREPDSSTGGGHKGAESEGGKVRGVTVSTSGELRGKRRKGEGEGASGGVSSTGGRAGEGGARRPVKSWQEDRRCAAPSFSPFPSFSISISLPLLQVQQLLYFH